MFQITVGALHKIFLLGFFSPPTANDMQAMDYIEGTRVNCAGLPEVSSVSHGHGQTSGVVRPQATIGQTSGTYRSNLRGP